MFFQLLSKNKNGLVILIISIFSFVLLLLKLWFHYDAIYLKHELLYTLIIIIPWFMSLLFLAKTMKNNYTTKFHIATLIILILMLILDWKFPLKIDYFRNKKFFYKNYDSFIKVTNDYDNGNSIIDNHYMKLKTNSKTYIVNIYEKDEKFVLFVGTNLVALSGGEGFLYSELDINETKDLVRPYHNIHLIREIDNNWYYIHF